MSSAMRFVLLTVIKDLRRWYADPLALVVWFGIPIGLGVTMAMATGGGAGIERARLLVVDQDDTFLSHLVAGALPPDLVTVESVTLEDGRSRIDAGDASALLILPEGFSEAVIEGTPATVGLIENPAQHILPRIIRTLAEIAVEAAFYIPKLGGEELRRAVDRDDDVRPSLEEFISVGSAAAERFHRLSGVLSPLVLEFETVTPRAEADDERPSFLVLFVPSLVFMSMLFIAQGMSDDIWKEHSRGTLRRALRAPHAAATFLAGKCLAAWSLAGAGALLALVVGVVGFELSPLRAAQAFAWCLLCAPVFIALFLAIQSFGSTERGASLLGTTVLFPLMMIGGTFFPFEAMPEWMVAIGAWTPNGVGVLRLKELLAGTAHAAELLSSAFTLALLTGALFALATTRSVARFGRA